VRFTVESEFDQKIVKTCIKYKKALSKRLYRLLHTISQSINIRLFIVSMTERRPEQIANSKPNKTEV